MNTRAAVADPDTAHTEALAAAIWAALPEEHEVFAQCSKLAAARRTALAAHSTASSAPADTPAASSCGGAAPVATPARARGLSCQEVATQGLPGATPVDTLFTLTMLHDALRARARQAPETRAWHLTACGAAHFCFISWLRCEEAVPVGGEPCPCFLLLQCCGGSFFWQWLFTRTAPYVSYSPVHSLSACSWSAGNRA